MEDFALQEWKARFKPENDDYQMSGVLQCYCKGLEANPDVGLFGTRSYEVSETVTDPETGATKVVQYQVCNQYVTDKYSKLVMN